MIRIEVTDNELFDIIMALMVVDNRQQRDQGEAAVSREPLLNRLCNSFERKVMPSHVRNFRLQLPGSKKPDSATDEAIAETQA